MAAGHAASIVLGVEAATPGKRCCKKSGAAYVIGAVQHEDATPGVPCRARVPADWFITDARSFTSASISSIP